MKTYPSFQKPAAEVLTEEAYQAFLRSKVPGSSECGFEISEDEIYPMLKPHQKAGVLWTAGHGRAASFDVSGADNKF